MYREKGYFSMVFLWSISLLLEVLVSVSCLADHSSNTFLMQRASYTSFWLCSGFWALAGLLLKGLLKTSQTFPAVGRTLANHGGYSFQVMIKMGSFRCTLGCAICLADVQRCCDFSLTNSVKPWDHYVQCL